MHRVQVFILVEMKCLLKFLERNAKNKGEKMRLVFATHTVLTGTKKRRTSDKAYAIRA